MDSIRGMTSRGIVRGSIVLDGNLWCPRNNTASMTLERALATIGAAFKYRRTSRCKKSQDDLLGVASGGV